MTQTPRVAVVIPRYFPIFGGAENQAALLNHHLVNGRFALIPFVLTKRLRADLPRAEVVDAIPVRRLGIPGIGRWSDYAFYLAALLFLIRHNKRYDLIHCHGSSLLGAIVALAGRSLGKSVIVKLASRGELAGPMVLDPVAARGRRWLSRGLATITRRYSHVVALNRAGEQEVFAARTTGEHSVIPNGVDISRFRPPTPAERVAARRALSVDEDETLVVYSGRFVNSKGLDTLLEAFEAARASAPNLRLSLVGSGEHQLDSAAALLQDHLERPESGITAVPRVDDVVSLLAAADGFVLPSRSEGLPNAVLEAVAMGVPCLLSDIPPHQELAERNPAASISLFRTGSVSDLRAGLVRLSALDHRAVRENGLAPEYHMDDVVRRYGGLYRRMLGVMA